jgi:hypothetical protein
MSTTVGPVGIIGDDGFSSELLLSPLSCSSSSSGGFICLGHGNSQYLLTVDLAV